MADLGDKFRKARETKGITLEDASNVTKISSRMLQAIEEEHFDQLPGGVFNKGFIRAYAKHLGINDQEAVNEYLEYLRQEQIKAQAMWQPQVPPAGPEKGSPFTGNRRNVKAPDPAPAAELPDLQLPRAEHVRPPSQKYLDRGENGIPLRLIVVAVLVIVLATLLLRRHPATGTASPALPATVPAAQTAPVPQIAPVLQTAPVSVPATTSAPLPAENTPVVPAAGTAETQAPSLGNPSTPANRIAGATAASTVKPAADEESDAPQQSNDVAAAPPAGKPAETLALVIRALENSWISVSADGQSSSQETLIAPARTSVRANRQIVVRVGNAAGVTFQLNGKEIRAQGAEGEVKSFVFDAQGMRVTAAPTAPPTQNQ